MNQAGLAMERYAIDTFDFYPDINIYNVSKARQLDDYTTAAPGVSCLVEYSLQWWKSTCKFGQFIPW